MSHKDPIKRKQYMKEWRKKNPDYDFEYRKINRLRIRYKDRAKRLTVIGLLGSKCVKCGFSDIRGLVLDHKNGGGCKERKQHNHSTANMYAKYCKNPELAFKNLQVLCANCNMIKTYEEKEWFKGNDID